MKKRNFSWILTFLLFLTTFATGVTKDKEKPPENTDNRKNENILLVQQMTWLSAGPLVNRQTGNSLFNKFIEKKLRSGVDYYGFMHRRMTESYARESVLETDSVKLSDTIDWQNVFDNQIRSDQK